MPLISPPEEVQAVPEFYLVRHGESAANILRRFDSTPPGAALTERGLQQAERLGDWFENRGIRPDLIVSSHFLRALQTAAPLQRRSGRPLVVADQLRETDLGDWDGLLSRDVQDDPLYRRWHENPEIAPPGGERLSDVGARLMLLLSRLEALDAGSCLSLFSHQHALRAALAICGAMRTADGRHEPLPNCSILHLSLQRGRLRLLGLDRSIATAPDDRKEAI